MCCHIVFKHVHAINFLSVLLSFKEEKQMTHLISSAITTRKSSKIKEKLTKDGRLVMWTLTGVSKVSIDELLDADRGRSSIMILHL